MPAARKVAAWWILGGAALALRLAAVGLLATEHAAPVTYEHGAIAKNLLAGRGFSIWFLGSDGPTSQQSPLYPVLIAGAYAIWGVESPAALLAVQLLQCLAGTATVLAVVWLIRSMLPEHEAAAWWGGILAACYPAHIYMVTQIQVVAWACLLLVLLAAVVYEPRWHGRTSVGIAAGILSGLLLLVEPILALALPWLWWVYLRGLRAGHASESIWRSALLWRAAVMPLVAVVMIAPWTLRNRAVHGEWVFVKSTFGYAFWQANNPSSWGTDKIPKPTVQTLLEQHDGTLAGMHRAMWEARHETLYIDDVLIKPHGYERFAGLSEPARSRVLGREAWQFIREQPLDYARLCAARLWYFLVFDPTNPKTAHPLYRIPNLLLVALALLGMTQLRRDAWRQCWPIVAILVSLVVFHSLVITSARFRMPLEPLAMGFAATGMLAMWQWVLLRLPIRGTLLRLKAYCS